VDSPRQRVALALTAAGALGAALWWRRNPSACPYSQRFWVELPHPFITRGRLREALGPRPGERLLEVGPGTGYYTLAVAEWLGPQGRLDIVDVQREMLDHTSRRARERGLRNVFSAGADARELPYEPASFDGAFLVAVLGEVPDQEAALRELRRVLRPDGRIVVGELLLDPHVVTTAALERRAKAAGLRVDGRLGGSLWHFTRLRHAERRPGG
jgi:ubiquinone/menaquinone biosynthesis C-methylase UbiE